MTVYASASHIRRRNNLRPHNNPNHTTRHGTMSCGAKRHLAKVRIVLGLDATSLSDMSWATIYAVFRVPTTHDVITALFHPSYPKSHIDILNLGLLALQLILFYTLPPTPRKLFFFLYFAFWRAAYDAGLGYVLTKQSKRKWIVKTVEKLGWLDQERRPEVRAWIRRQLVGKMGKDYSFDVRLFIHVADSLPRSTAHLQELPLEYNTWLLFRQAVDIILIKCVSIPVICPDFL